MSYRITKIAEEVAKRTEGMAVSDGGIIVPEHVAEEQKQDLDEKKNRIEVRWPWKNLKRIREFVLWCEKNRLAFVLVCQQCRHEIKTSHKAPFFYFRCECTERQIQED